MWWLGLSNPTIPATPTQPLHLLNSSHNTPPPKKAGNTGGGYALPHAALGRVTTALLSAMDNEPEPEALDTAKRVLLSHSPMYDLASNTQTDYSWVFATD